MARRRRKMFGSSPEAHMEAAIASDRQAREMFDSAFDAADAGKCEIALNDLTKAHFFMGQTLADMKGSGEYEKLQNTRASPDNYMSTMRKLSSDVVSKCAKTRVAGKKS